MYVDVSGATKGQIVAVSVSRTSPSDANVVAHVVSCIASSSVPLKPDLEEAAEIRQQLVDLSS